MDDFVPKTRWTVGDSLGLMRRMENDSVDLVLADPPYDFSPKHKFEFQQEMERVSRGQVIVFCPPENIWRPVRLEREQWLFWVKPISTKNTSKSYSRFVEMIGVFGDGKWNAGRHWSQYTNVFTDLVDDARLHPFRKPPSLIERLLLNHADEGDAVLDPFAGSGVVAEVCRHLKINCISIELEREHDSHGQLYTKY